MLGLGLWCYATINNISVISWRSALLVEEIGMPEKPANLSQVIDKLYHIVILSTPRNEQNSNSQR